MCCCCHSGSEDPEPAADCSDQFLLVILFYYFDLGAQMKSWVVMPEGVFDCCLGLGRMELAFESVATAGWLAVLLWGLEVELSRDYTDRLAWNYHHHTHLFLAEP